MPLSTKQLIEQEIDSIYAQIQPSLDRIKELQSALNVINNLSKREELRPKITVGSKRHKPRTRYGDKTIHEYIIETGKKREFFSVNDVRSHVRYTYGLMIKTKSITAALSILLLQKKKILRRSKGIYTLRPNV